MANAFWILSILAMGGACLCAAQSSCYREQGDERSQTTAAAAIWLFIVSVLAAWTAWGM